MLYNLLETIRICAGLLTPFMPDTAAEIERRIHVEPATWESLGQFGLLPADAAVTPGEALFPRIDMDKELEALEALSAAQKEKAAQPAKTGVPPVLPEVSIDDFAKCDFRVCRILACEKVANSDKLLRFTLDDGSGAERQILSGMAPYYPEPQALVGKKVVAILNLPARKMAGLESNGMLLSAERDGKVYLTILDDAVPAGAQIS